jgi:hypothetical protein
MKKFYIPWPQLITALAVPITVLALHELLGHLGIRRQHDHLLHFLGGFSISFLIYVVLKMLFPVIGRLTQTGLYLFTFVASLCAALFWEYGEFLSDFFGGTHVQQSASETMFDLMFGTIGTISALVLIFATRIAIRRLKAQQDAAANP